MVGHDLASWGSSVPHPWVDQGIRKVRKEASDEDEGRSNEVDGHGDGNVSRKYRFHKQASHSGPRENDFNDNRAGKEAGECNAQAA
jgi:hypothetical protein